MTTKRLADLGVELSGVLRGRRAAAARALYQEGELIATRSRDLTPVDTGALRGSTHVAGPEQAGPLTIVTVAVGGPAAPYAIYVHEDMEARHPVGQAKFLEVAALEAAPELSARVAARVTGDAP